MNKNYLLLCVVYVLLAGCSDKQKDFYRNQFELWDVQLLDGPFKHARDLNIQVLLKYDVDRLLS